jgi:C-terminal processing protease CtpA/Prc
MSLIFRARSFLFLVLAIGALGCTPAPRQELTSEQKQGDIDWLADKFAAEYAPLTYKQDRYQFTLDGLRASYKALAAATRSNDEFYILTHRFVSEFKDAHTSEMVMEAVLPGRDSVAYLGFDAKRKGDKLVVTELLPTIASDSVFPVKKGDIISEIDGVAVVEGARSLFGLRDLGQDESNLTYHMANQLFRISSQSIMPSKDSATLKLTRGGVEMTVVLPWVIKDYHQFSVEQRDAAAQKKPDEEKKPDASADENYFDIAARVVDGNLSALFQVLARNLQGNPQRQFWDTFVFLDTLPRWTSRSTHEILRQVGLMLKPGQAPQADDDVLAKARAVPANVVRVSEAKTYPAYFKIEKELDKDGKPTGREKNVGYILLDTFSPSAESEDAVVKEVTETLKTMQAYGVKDLIVDMIDNGGGSLSLGMRLAQVFSKDPVAMPEIEFKINDTWMDEWETQSMTGKSDAEKEIARRVLQGMKEDLAAGRKLSRRFSAETLIPFTLVKNANLDKKLNIVLLVNEMCASMCDIFTGIMKDNGLVKIVGQRTMGAGGNVVTLKDQSTNAHVVLNQTQSLMVRRDGSYIENNGIEPDVQVTVSDSVLEKYEAVRKKAVDLLFTLPLAE